MSGFVERHFQSLVDSIPGLNDVSSLFEGFTSRRNRNFLSEEENQKLNNSIRTFLLLSGPLMLTGSFETCLDHLIRVYDINDHNVDHLVQALLPYHESSLFFRTVPLLKLDDQSRWAWLLKTVKKGTPIKRSHIVEFCVRDHTLFESLSDTGSSIIERTAAAYAEAEMTHPFISFYTSLSSEVLTSIKNAKSSSQYVTYMMPYIVKCLERNRNSDIFASALALISILSSSLQLEASVVKALLDLMLSSLRSHGVSRDTSVLVLMTACTVLERQHNFSLFHFISDGSMKRLTRNGDALLADWCSIIELREAVDLSPLLNAIIKKAFFLKNGALPKYHEDSLQSILHVLTAVDPNDAQTGSSLPLLRRYSTSIILSVVDAFHAAFHTEDGEKKIAPSSVYTASCVKIIKAAHKANENAIFTVLDILKKASASNGQFKNIRPVLEILAESTERKVVIENNDIRLDLLIPHSTEAIRRFVYEYHSVISSLQWQRLTCALPLPTSSSMYLPMSSEMVTRLDVILRGMRTALEEDNDKHTPEDFLKILRPIEKSLYCLYFHLAFESTLTGALVGMKKSLVALLAVFGGDLSLSKESEFLSFGERMSADDEEDMWVYVCLLFQFLQRKEAINKNSLLPSAVLQWTRVVRRIQASSIETMYHSHVSKIVEQALKKLISLPQLSSEDKNSMIKLCLEDAVLFEDILSILAKSKTAIEFLTIAVECLVREKSNPTAAQISLNALKFISPSFARDASAEEKNEISTFLFCLLTSSSAEVRKAVVALILSIQENTTTKKGEHFDAMVRFFNALLQRKEALLLDNNSVIASLRTYNNLNNSFLLSLLRNVIAYLGEEEQQYLISFGVFAALLTSTHQSFQNGEETMKNLAKLYRENEGKKCTLALAYMYTLMKSILVQQSSLSVSKDVLEKVVVDAINFHKERSESSPILPLETFKAIVEFVSSPALFIKLTATLRAQIISLMCQLAQEKAKRYYSLVVTTLSFAQVDSKTIIEAFQSLTKLPTAQAALPVLLSILPSLLSRMEDSNVNEMQQLIDILSSRIGLSKSTVEGENTTENMKQLCMNDIHCIESVTSLLTMIDNNPKALQKVPLKMRMAIEKGIKRLEDYPVDAILCPLIHLVGTLRRIDVSSSENSVTSLCRYLSLLSEKSSSITSSTSVLSVFAIYSKDVIGKCEDIEEATKDYVSAFLKGLIISSMRHMDEWLSLPRHMSKIVQALGVDSSLPYAIHLLLSLCHDESLQSSTPIENLKNATEECITQVLSPLPNHIQAHAISKVLELLQQEMAENVGDKKNLTLTKNGMNIVFKRLQSIGIPSFIDKKELDEADKIFIDALSLSVLSLLTMQRLLKENTAAEGTTSQQYNGSIEQSVFILCDVILEAILTSGNVAYTSVMIAIACLDKDEICKNTILLERLLTLVFNSLFKSKQLFFPEQVHESGKRKERVDAGEPEENNTMESENIGLSFQKLVQKVLSKVIDVKTNSSRYAESHYGNVIIVSWKILSQVTRLTSTSQLYDYAITNEIISSLTHLLPSLSSSSTGALEGKASTHIIRSIIDSTTLMVSYHSDMILPKVNPLHLLLIDIFQKVLESYDREKGPNQQFSIISIVLSSLSLFDKLYIHINKIIGSRVDSIIESVLFAPNLLFLLFDTPEDSSNSIQQILQVFERLLTSSLSSLPLKKILTLIHKKTLSQQGKQEETRESMYRYYLLCLLLETSLKMQKIDGEVESIVITHSSPVIELILLLVQIPMRHILQVHSHSPVQARDTSLSILHEDLLSPLVHKWQQTYLSTYHSLSQGRGQNITSLLEKTIQQVIIAFAYKVSNEELNSLIHQLLSWARGEQTAMLSLTSTSPSTLDDKHTITDVEWVTRAMKAKSVIQAYEVLSNRLGDIFVIDYINWIIPDMTQVLHATMNQVEVYMKKYHSMTQLLKKASSGSFFWFDLSLDAFECLYVMFSKLPGKIPRLVLEEKNLGAVSVLESNTLTQRLIDCVDVFAWMPRLDYSARVESHTQGEAREVDVVMQMRDEEDSDVEMEEEREEKEESEEEVEMEEEEEEGGVVRDMNRKWYLGLRHAIGELAGSVALTSTEHVISNAVRDSHMKIISDLLISKARSNNANVRAAALDLLRVVWDKSGLSIIGTLSDMLALLADLMDDVDPIVEKNARRLLKHLESITGESLISRLRA